MAKQTLIQTQHYKVSYDTDLNICYFDYLDGHYSPRLGYSSFFADGSYAWDGLFVRPETGSCYQYTYDGSGFTYHFKTDTIETTQVDTLDFSIPVNDITEPFIPDPIQLAEFLAVGFFICFPVFATIFGVKSIIQFVRSA